MTDEAKALVERMEEWALTLLAACEGGDLGTDEPAALMYQARDLIETQARENERLRDTPNRIWAEARDSEWDEGFNYAVKLFRAALAGDSHD